MNTKRCIILLLALPLLLLIITGCGTPQGTITGYLYGDSINLQITGSATAPATMNAVNGGTITVSGRSVTTNSAGYFSISDIPTGNRMVTAVFNGVGDSFPVTVVANHTATPSSNNIYRSLKDSVTVDTSCFNGNAIYTMVTAQPSNKPESNSGPTTMNSYTLTTTDLDTLSISSYAYSYEERSESGNNASVSPQAKWDLLLRERENQALASKAKQLNKTSAKGCPANPVFGTIWNDVYVNNGTNMVQIDTTCLHVSTHAFFFVDNRDIADISPSLTGYGTAFDAIYNTVINKFGTVNDKDNNGKIIIIFSRELELGSLVGYFSSTDKYTKTTYAQSNEGDILYVTTATAQQGDPLKAVLAHELQHMIYFDQHYNYGVTNTYTWLNEALSQAAVYYTGYTAGHDQSIRAFLNNGWAGKSLTHWSSDNYGYVSLFIHYLMDQYGDTAIKNMCSSVNAGIAAVEAATGDDFNNIYYNFTRALVMSGTGDSTNPRYEFISLDLQAIQTEGRKGLITNASYSAGTTVTGSLYPYRLSFLQWNGNFGAMNLSGTDIFGTGFGLSQ